MRLRHVWISDYKNLKDFSISFEGDGFIDVFVGKNVFPVSTYGTD